MEEIKIIKKLILIISISALIFTSIVYAVPTTPTKVQYEEEESAYVTLMKEIGDPIREEDIERREKEIEKEVKKEEEVNNYMKTEVERIERNRKEAEERVKMVKSEAEKVKLKAERDAIAHERSLIKETELAMNKTSKSEDSTNKTIVNPAIKSDTNINVPRNNNKKTYMDYKKITSPNSIQYKMQRSGEMWIDENGFQRYGEEGMYVIALGTGYSPQAGYVFDITLKNGNTFRAITGDIKSDRHTDSTRKQHAKDGSVVEFLVNTENKKDENLPIIHPKAMVGGDMSKCPDSDMYGDILSINRVGGNDKWK